MFWYLLGNTPCYSLVFILCFFLTQDKLKPFCVAIMGLMLIDQSSNPYILEHHSDSFFIIKALLDLVWLLIVWFMTSNTKVIKPLFTVCTISLFLNVYLIFDISDNFIYQYWNEINFLLFECIIYLILKESPYIKSLSSWLHKAATDMTKKII